MNVRPKLVSPIIMWLAVVAGIFLIFWLLPAGHVFSRSIFTSFLIFPAIAYWLYFFIGAVRVHRKAPQSADKIDRIVREGVYAKVRHPIYAADIILGWSIFFFYPDFRFMISAYWLTCVLLYWMNLEERVLIDKFGDQYLEYIRRVPKFFPKLSK